MSPVSRPLRDREKSDLRSDQDQLLKSDLRSDQIMILSRIINNDLRSFARSFLPHKHVILRSLGNF